MTLEQELHILADLNARKLLDYMYYKNLLRRDVNLTHIYLVKDAFMDFASGVQNLERINKCQAPQL